MICVTNPRQLAFLALQDVYQKQAYTDIALDRVLRQAEINKADRGLICELVYGIVRRRRTLDTLIDTLGKKKSRATTTQVTHHSTSWFISITLP